MFEAPGARDARLAVCGKLREDETARDAGSSVVAAVASFLEEKDRTMICVHCHETRLCAHVAEEW